MGNSNCFTAFSGAVALTLVGMAAPGQAQAQHYQCELEDTSYGYYGDHFTECGESIIDVTTFGPTMQGLGDAWANQQLNFGGFAGFVSPTGRLRHTNHDGLRDGNGQTTGPFEIDEASFFGNASYDLPGTYFGGKVRIAGLIGWTGLQQDDVAKTFSSDIDSIVYGGSYLWSQGSFYSMSMIIGISGEVDTRNAGGSYSYGVTAYFTNTVVGYTFDWPGSLKFDLRGNVGNYDVSGDSFVVPTTGTAVIKGSAEGWSAGITGTLFTLIEMDGGVARPYLAVQYKQVFSEDIEIRGAATLDFNQDDSYGKFEAGYDFVQGVVTFGAAVYTEISGDQDTVGGRLGVSVKLQ